MKPQFSVRFLVFFTTLCFLAVVLVSLCGFLVAVVLYFVMAFPLIIFASTDAAQNLGVVNQIIAFLILGALFVLVLGLLANFNFIPSPPAS